ncbi:hypothetical protein BDF21DRAFT_416009 [Thamnidium elegans]|nr:hypothetical protein BDF21DRAFT_416009 [Thamnidium elegans]
MNNPKALQTFLDLEIARCNERWTDIPELARRYKKYHPYESVLEFTARMEAEFILLLRQVRQEKSKSIISIESTTSQLDLNTSTSNSRKWGNRQIANTASSTNLNTPPVAVKKNYPEESDFIHQLDDPNNVAMSLPLESSQAQLILVRLLDVIQRQIKSGQLETIDDWQAQFSKIILARIYFETERYDKTLEWLQQLALKLEDVESGYSMVLLVQARVMKGICYESQENHIDALDCYLSALKVVEDHPDEENKSLSYWVENCLYRAILLQLRKKGPVKQTLKLMRAYLSYCCTQWPLDWRIHKRWVIFRHYIRYLTRAYQKGVYVPATAQDEYTTSPVLSPTKSVFSDAGETTLFERSSAALEETILLTTQFRQLLATFAPLLIQSNPADLHHRTLELSHLLVSAHETVGWGPDSYIQRTLKYFVRTRKFTFNSLCTTRHIFYTLVRVGETKQAKLALTCYLELLGVPDFIECYQTMDLVSLVDVIKSKLQSITQRSSESGSNNVYQIETKLNALMDELSSEDDETNGTLPKKKSATGSCESDTEFDVVRLLLLATQYLYPNLGQEATVLTDIAVALLEESDFLKKKKASQWRGLMVQAKRLCGTSYALYASQCHDEEKRSEYLTESLLSLKRATELDPRSWQAFYQLGIQQVITGDMPAASNSVKRSIKLRGDFIPSWHLLSLIQSSRQFHALPKSLQVIQAGLVYHLNLVENEDNEDIVQDLRLDTEEGQEFFDRAEAFLKMRLSQTTILENLEGAESTIKVYPDLFDMYSKLSKKMNIALAEKATTTAVRKSSMHESSIRSRSRSRANSSVHSLEESSESLDSGFALPLPADDFKTMEDSRSLTLNKMGSRSSSSHRIESRSLNKVNEDEEDNEEDDYVPEKVSKKKKKRGSINLSQLMDDPLISLPTKNSKEKKEKKEKPLKRSTTFLGLKRNDSSRKDLEQEVPSSSSNLKEISRNNSSSNNTVKSNTLSVPHQTSNYSSLLDKVDESTVSLVSATTTTTTTTTTTPNTIENDYFKERQIRWHNILVDIWIMTSATYARAHRFEEAHKAIIEADELTLGVNADVWHQVGKNCLLEGLGDRAVEAYKRALSIDPEHISTHISLSSVYLSMDQVELAEQLLQRSTRGLGWNQTEAWFLLSKVYQDQGNLLDAKKCLLFALKLSDTSPIVSVSSLPRFV